jgi:predicted ATPase
MTTHHGIMYLHKIIIQNIRSIKHFELAFEPKKYAGWHVIIGDNGSGKSTLVSAIALALIGAFDAPALRQNWDNWLRSREEKGHIQLEIVPDSKFDKMIGKEAFFKHLYAQLGFNRLTSLRGQPVVLEVPEIEGINPKNSLWGNSEGWFSASYGAFRRFYGGDRDYERLFHSNPKLAPHLSAFGENVALTEGLNWLQNLHIKQLEGKDDGRILNALKTFLNDGGLLPHNTVLQQVTSDAVVFVDGNGCEVAVEQLSDGYRSILSMTFELIRQLVGTYGSTDVFQSIQQNRMEIDLPGVVLIDEIDAHLHPTWQRQIGFWLQRYFPKLQFIVTTHSPLVCQAAEQGTIWRLPVPGSDFEGGRVFGIEFQRLVYGNILEALDTDLFGMDVTRSESSKEKLQHLATLNYKALQSQLSFEEEKERQQLRAMLPTAVNETTNGKQN